ncbi:hypothetical protein DPMN_146407 [Dreissena polymorpha]|uniref:Uncharacterized protein n=1 Tax=Dreissena polymorpha TaxID=45954 RepID=A0A9D4IYD9_DREPO|nr:hypothetical protein DPMN_146407 [Dreissena polymorpha]
MVHTCCSKIDYLLNWYFTVLFTCINLIYFTDYEAKSYTIDKGLALGKYKAATIMNTTTSSENTWRPASNGPYRHIRIKANPQNQPLKLCELQITGSPQPRTPRE